MSDTQKIVDKLSEARALTDQVWSTLHDLPEDERVALRPVAEMLVAIFGKLGRRIAAHSNALEVQS